MFRFAKLAE